MWRTSSHSGTGNCVQADSWRKSTASAGEGECAEVGQVATAGLVPMVAVRDTQDRDGGLLEFPPAAWAAFTARLKAR